jgi:hypothetical protein
LAELVETSGSEEGMRAESVSLQRSEVPVQQQVSTRGGNWAMTGGVAESWARLRLVQGDSTAQVWELVSSRGQTTLTVGSGPSSSWVVREEGVRPLHFSLHWDGSTLRIADTYGAGDVRVDDSPVTAQWRSLVGRVRIDFGKAAMVAETATNSSGAEPRSSTGERPEPVQPLEPAAAVPAPSASAVSLESPASQRLYKATLIGVASSLPVPAPSAGEGAKDAAAKASESGPPGADPLKVVRPTDSERARKATLLGVVVNVPPPAAAPQEVRPGTPAQGLANRTLLGVAVPLEARLQLLSGLSGQSSEQGKGVSLDDLRSIPPPASTPPAAGAVTQAEVAAAPPSSESPARIGSTWHETPEPRSGPSQPPMAVLVEPSPAESRAELPEDDDATYAARPSADYERYSDAPTTMRDAPSLDSRRVREPFPWRYVGIGLLTAAAYFAWLYLLDHL